MFVKKASEMIFDEITEPHVKKASINWAISKEDAPNFALRVIKIEPGGEVGLHNHAYEHGVYISKGRGHALSDGEPREFAAGDVVYIEPDIRHGFRNTGEETLEVICVIPV